MHIYYICVSIIIYIYIIIQNEARKLNHQEVVEEDRRKKLPVNYESRRRRAEWEIQEEEAKKVIKYLMNIHEVIYSIYSELKKQEKIMSRLKCWRPVLMSWIDLKGREKRKIPILDSLVSVSLSSIYLSSIYLFISLDYQQASYRQYQRLSKQIKPDMENYEKQKQEM